MERQFIDIFGNDSKIILIKNVCLMLWKMLMKDDFVILTGLSLQL